MCFLTEAFCKLTRIKQDLGITMVIVGQKVREVLIKQASAWHSVLGFLIPLGPFSFSEFRKAEISVVIQGEAVSLGNHKANGSKQAGCLYQCCRYSRAEL